VPLEMFTDIMIKKVTLLSLKRWFDIIEVVGRLDPCC